MYTCKYFKIGELVSPATLRHYGEFVCWQFFDSRMLEVLDRLREDLGKPIMVNYGRFTQRGFRSNLDSLCRIKTIQGKLYNSQHSMGRAVDFDVQGMSAQEVRKYIYDNQDRYPEITYMEDLVNWVHIDCRQSNSTGLLLFKG